jgi:hypothetical protein
MITTMEHQQGQLRVILGLLRSNEQLDWELLRMLFVSWNQALSAASCQ